MLIAIVALCQIALNAKTREWESNHSLSKSADAGQLRPLTTDRPDQTESPITVDAKHIQLETDVFFLSYDRHNTSFTDQRVTTYSVAVTNVRVGVSDNVELALVVEPYVSVEVDDRSTGQKTERSGLGDLTIRAKINLWGSDGGETAFALLPYLKLPTNSNGVGNDYIEGGILFPYAIELSDTLGLGLQGGVDFVRNDPGLGSDYATNFIYAAALGIDLGNDWGAYIESFNELSSEGGADTWASSIDFGATYLFNTHVQWDIGTNLGITRAADDITVFTGMTYRW